MNAGAVLHRELRAESRRPANYWLRVLAASTLVLVAANLLLGPQPGLARLGPILFDALHRSFVFALWTLVPMMTADCVSREKREGTLGLLFLTPLSMLDVIAGKAALHVLRALTLFLAALPVLGLPLVLGGVSWPDLSVSTAHQTNAVLLSIGAGIYASTKGGTAIQAMVRAELYALGLACVSSIWTQPLWGIAAKYPAHLPWAIGVTLLLSLIVLGVLMKLGEDRLQQTWQDEPAAPEQPGWVELFSSSQFWRDFFYWDKSQTLDRNPIAWLQEYSWTARLTKWGWCLLALAIQWFVLTQWDPRRAPVSRFLIGAGFALVVAFTSVASFRREQQTGLLELVLVTPVSIRQLLRGRLWGIGCHFFPAVAMLCIGWIGDRLFYPDLYRAGPLKLAFPNPLALVCVMVVGLYFSLCRLNFFLAWLSTWLVAFVLPTIIMLGLGPFAGLGQSMALLLPSAFQAWLAVTLWVLLKAKVRLRSFPYFRTEGSAAI